MTNIRSARGFGKKYLSSPKDDDCDADDEDGDSVVRAAACELADQLTLDNCHGGTGRPWAGCSHSCKTVTRCGLIEEADFSWIFKSIFSVHYWEDLYSWRHRATVSRLKPFMHNGDQVGTKD